MQGNDGDLNGTSVGPKFRKDLDPELIFLHVSKILALNGYI